MKSKIPFVLGIFITLILAGHALAAKPNGASCTYDFECTSGNCINRYCCNAGQCGYYYACYNEGYVRGDYICMSETWKKLNGESCSTGTECASGYCIGGYCCNPGQCSYYGSCYNEAAIRGDYICMSGIWKKLNGESCSTDSQCASGNCIAGYCCNPGQCSYYGSCYNEGATRSDYVCMSETWKKINGESCSSGSQCASGYCTNGYCCNMGQCGYYGSCYNSGTKNSAGNTCFFGTWYSTVNIVANLQNSSGVKKTEFSNCCNTTFEPVYLKVCLNATTPKCPDPYVYVVPYGVYTLGANIPDDVTEKIENITTIPACTTPLVTKIWDHVQPGTWTVILDIDMDKKVDAYEVVDTIKRFDVTYCECTTTTTTTTSTTTSTTCSTTTTSTTTSTTTTTCPTTTTTTTTSTTTTTCPTTTTTTSTTTTTKPTTTTTTTTTSTTTTTTSSTTTTVPNVPEFAETGIGTLLAVLLISPAFAYLMVKKRR